MRKLFCRFQTEKELSEFNPNLPNNVKTYNLDDDTYTTFKSKGKKIIKEKEWIKYWKYMPKYVSKDPDNLVVEIYTNKSSEELSKVFGQHITEKTKSIWFPFCPRPKIKTLRTLGEGNPFYPIFVISKGRYTKNYTTEALERMGVPFYLVVEPQEVEQYSNLVKYMTYPRLLVMDMSYKNKYDTLGEDTNSSVAVRNFVWDYSIKLGYDYHWIIDDNINDFYYFNYNIKHRVRTGAIFSIAENLFTRFENLAIGGFDYKMFCVDLRNQPAFNLNTRVYSCTFINNNIPFRWRGKYNEDTILCLDCLTHDWCIMQTNIFLADKKATQTVSGGNTEMYKADGGTEKKTDMLVNLYPQYAKKVIRYGRVHHYIDYSVFTTPLKYKKDIVIKQIPELFVVDIPLDWVGTDKDTKRYILDHLEETKEVMY